MSRKNERLNNVRRLSIALYSAIEGQNAHTEKIAVKRLADILHYMPDQLITDILELERYTSEKVHADREAAGEQDDD